jgi:hypothetical protein
LIVLCQMRLADGEVEAAPDEARRAYDIADRVRRRLPSSASS